jgi:hypothetical protein
MMKKKLCESRTKGKMDLKSQVSFPFGKFALSELYQGK